MNWLQQAVKRFREARSCTTSVAPRLYIMVLYPPPPHCVSTAKVKKTTVTRGPRA